MAVTVVNNNQVIHNADDITLWLANGGFAQRGLITLGNAQGTGAVEARSPSGGGIGHCTWDGTLPDFTGKHLLMWVFVTFPMSTKALGGMQIILSSAANSLTNFGAWNLLGSDDTGLRTYTGWNLIMVDCSRAFDETNGTPPALNAAVSMGQRTNILDGNGKTVPVQDAVWWADVNNNGLTITGGTNIAPATFSEIAAADKAGGYGVFKDVGTIYFANGKLRLGDGGTATSIIRDSNKVVVFENQPVSNTHYIVENVGNATATDNEVTLNSVLFKSAGPAFRFDAIDSNLNICAYTSCTIDGATQGVNWTNSNAVWSAGKITNSGLVTLNSGADMKGATISNSTNANGAVRLIANPVGDDFRDMILTGNPHGLLLQGTGNATFDLRNIVFTANTTKDIRIDYGVGDTVTLNLLEGTTALTEIGNITNVNGSTIVINNNKSIVLSPLIVGSVVSVYLAGTTTLVQETTNSGTSFNFSIGGGVAVDIVFFEGTEDAVIAHVPKRIQNISFSTDQTVTINQLLEPNFTG